MILSIDNNVIETKYISYVTDIKYYNDVNSKCSYLDACYIQFDIIFINKGHVRIERNIFKASKQRWNLTMNKVKLARNQLIKLWTPDRDLIPTITID